MGAILRHTLMISAFVAVMMILVEYVNVLTEGRWNSVLSGSRWKQYLIAALLGATPGCLGAFVVVALYVHRSVSLGAVVVCMIATSGDESFVMLALFPRTAALLTLGLAVTGVIAGAATDSISRAGRSPEACPDLLLHADREACQCFDPAMLLRQWSPPSVSRGVLSAGCALFVAALLTGIVGPAAWGWVRVTLLAVALFALFVVVTVPQHFIQEHLWRHVVRQHLPRILLWTFGALLVIALLDQLMDVERLIRNNPWVMLLVASVLGFIPESGPHLLFVTLYDHGTVPLSVLAASSIVQDGHGMLPLLAHSWVQFLQVKAINLAAGLVVASLMLALGW